MRFVCNAYFPDKTLNLQSLPFESNELRNLQIVIESFLNMIIITKNTKILKMLYPVIKLNRSSFENYLTTSLQSLIFNQLNDDQWLNFSSEILNDFLNEKLDKNIFNNSRFAIAKKIILTIFESSDQ